VLNALDNALVQTAAPKVDDLLLNDAIGFQDAVRSAGQNSCRSKNWE
jgi:hypothetical protein